MKTGNRKPESGILIIHRSYVSGLRSPKLCPRPDGNYRIPFATDIAFDMANASRNCTPENASNRIKAGSLSASNHASPFSTRMMIGVKIINRGGSITVSLCSQLLCLPWFNAFNASDPASMVNTVRNAP